MHCNGPDMDLGAMLKIRSSCESDCLPSIWVKTKDTEVKTWSESTLHTSRQLWMQEIWICGKKENYDGLGDNGGTLCHEAKSQPSAAFSCLALTLTELHSAAQRCTNLVQFDSHNTTLLLHNFFYTMWPSAAPSDCTINQIVCMYCAGPK